MLQLLDVKIIKDIYNSSTVGYIIYKIKHINDGNQ